MPTVKLFHADPTQTEFTAKVLQCTPAGQAWDVTLDQTCFYAEGGGQPSDAGLLGGRSVMAVREEDDGTIVHTVDGPLQGEVQGQVDGNRRLDHSEQHTGQHLLSGAFERLFDAETVSWHLGSDHCTVDLEMELLTPDQADQVEHECNRVIRACLPVVTHVVDEAAARTMPLRKLPKVTGEIRVVELHGYDWSACGGTHVANTGALGILKIKSWERYKKTTRISFLAGGRATGDYAAIDRLTRELCRSLTIAVGDLPRWVDRSQEENMSLRKVLKVQQDKLFDLEATQLVDSARKAGSARLVQAAFAGRPVDEVKLLATKVASRPSTVAIFGTRGAIPQIVIQRAVDLRFDAGAVIRQVLPVIGGKGGGSPIQAQGGGSRPEALDQALDQATQTIIELLGH